MLKYSIKDEDDKIKMINVDTFEGLNAPPIKMQKGVPPTNFGKQTRVYSAAQRRFRSMGGLFGKR